MKIKKEKKKNNNDTTEVLEENKNDTGAQEIKLESGVNSKVEDLKEIEKLQKEIESLKNENKSLVDKVKLSQAELINYRVRKDEEVQGMLKYANQDIIKELILFVDNFDRAIVQTKKIQNDEVQKYLSGYELMYNQLKTILNKFEVEEINRPGEVFDPKLEEAIVAECVEDKDDEIVLEVLQKGYKLKDRVIRPARVKINQK